MRLIDADALRKHAVEADRMGAMLVVGLGYILDAPTIESKASEGRWKGAGMGDYRCSLCDETVNGKYKFCSNCGAKNKEDTA